MRRRRRTKKLGQEAVELNLAAMLDMAFQLLTFFILTFKPAESEVEISLRLPQAAPGGTTTEASLGREDILDPLRSLDSLTISVAADPQGGIASMAIESERIPPANLAARLRTLLSDPDSPLKQVVIQAASGLRYDALMSVVDQCARQTLPGGAALKKLSFIEFPDGN